MPTALLCLSFLFAVQEDRLESLIRQLGDPAPERRDEAERKLAEEGTSAAPLLRKAVQGDDPEVAIRAKKLLRYLSILPHITPKLREAMPDIQERLLRIDWSIGLDKPSPPLPPPRVDPLEDRMPR